MKHLYKTIIVFWSIATFILSLYLALVPMINSSSFFQNIWEKEGIYEQMDISEEELTKVIDKTMDYMWGKVDDLQITVTFNDGHSEEFYKNWGLNYEGKVMDELGHMADCRVLFMAGKSLATLSLVVWIISTGVLFIYRKQLEPKYLNASYITYGVIGAIMLFIGIAAIIDFDTVFKIFHLIFFSDSNNSWTYPYASYMIQMLPEDALFANVVYRTLIQFTLIFGSMIGLTIFIQKKALKPKKTSMSQEL